MRARSRGRARCSTWPRSAAFGRFDLGALTLRSIQHRLLGGSGLLLRCLDGIAHLGMSLGLGSLLERWRFWLATSKRGHP